MSNSVSLYNRSIAALVFILLMFGASQTAGAVTTETTAKYFPLQSSSRWVLKQSSTTGQVSFEVISTDGLASRLRATTPWGSSDWELTDRTNQYDMTAYGSTAGVAPLGVSLPMYRFDAATGAKWTNMLGTFTVTAKGVTVTAGSKTYSNCVTIRQDANGTAFITTFAPGTGMVQYSVAGLTFDLDVASSRIPVFPSTSFGALPPLGVLPNVAADEIDNAAAANRRLDTLSSGGMKFLLGYGSWTQMEPTTGKFDMGSLKYHVSIVSSKGWSSAYTLTLINMDKKEVPSDLMGVAWSSTKMQNRVLKLIDNMAAQFKGKIDYFQFGNEVDTYFATHPSEVDAYLTLFNAVKTRLKTKSPGTKVSITFKQSSLAQLSTTYSKLYPACDLLVVTYGPYTPNYDAMAPSAAVPDFAAVKTAAQGRKILFQEIAYPSAAENTSSPEQQAQFFSTLLNEFRGASGQVVAAQIFLLSELSSSSSSSMTTSLGMASVSKFNTLLQSLGLFDVYSLPKPAWSLISSETTH